ncbi:Rgp1-domain-containing protein [Scleroderma citrinum]
MSADDVTNLDVDAAIRVQVTPSQASYFAGEEFTVTITFTNTRTPESPKPRNTHRRGAHSISSAPLARPPTSPGIPRPTALPTSITRTPSNGCDVPARKNLIGQGSNATKGSQDMKGILEQKRQNLLEKSRSLSVDIPARELPKNEENGKDTRSQYVRAYNEFSDVAGLPSTASPSPLPRTSEFQLPPHHPHARKHSVLDGQAQLSEVPAPPPPPALASSSTPTFSIALDPIAESPVSPYLGSPSPRSPPLNDPLKPTPLKRESQLFPRSTQGKSPHLNLGHGPPPAPASRSVVLPRASTTEVILYSYAQLLGAVSITPLPGASMSQEHAKTLNGLRARLLKRPIVGGGSMDITSRQRVQERKRSHSRASSLTSGLLSLLSPSSSSVPSSPIQSSPPPWKTGNPRSPTAASSPSSALMNGGPQEDIDAEMPLPTFEVQPTMLAVDLSLTPGESRTYTYSLILPPNLPPTFRGRSLRLSYELVIGTCRASAPAMRSSSSLGPTGANSISRVMKVPIRVYNNVAVGNNPGCYDLLWPMARPRISPEFVPRVVDGPLKQPNGTSKIPLPAKASTHSLNELQSYGRRLLGTFRDPHSTDNQIPSLQEAADLEREIETDGGALTGCREAVEILTRNPKKVSYDVNKDGVKVAVLTFPKSAYRLGETILGVVEVNELWTRSRVLSLSAMLEAQERLPGPIASAGNTRHMRRVHAEHHSSFVASTLRTTFSLDIPSDGSPSFQIQIGDDAKGIPGSVGGLVWRVRLCLLVAIASESSQVDGNGVCMKSLIRDGPAGEWGTPYRASPTIAPMERLKAGPQDMTPQSSSWTQYLVTSILGNGDRRYHDGDEEVHDGVQDRGWAEHREREDGWQEVKVEMVECELPITVWPGNTAFKAMDVVFDV